MNDLAKRISIIIPHYNSFSGLEKLLKSIPEDERLEILVIDDKSEDQNKLNEFIKNYKNVNFLINTSSNKNAGAARNIGLANASGEWLLFADADDFFLENAFRELFNDIQHVGSDVDIIYYRPESLDLTTSLPSNRHLQYKQLVHAFIETESPDIRYLFFVPWSKLIKKSLIDKHQVGFDEVIASNDMMFSTKVGHYAREILAKDFAIYCVTKGKKTLTTDKSIGIIRARYEVQLSYNDFLLKNSKKYYQFSFLYLCKKYRKILTCHQFISLLFKLCLSYIPLISRVKK